MGFRWWESIDHGLALRYAHIGASVHRNTCFYISFAVIVMLLCSAGVVNININTEAEDSWTAPSRPIHDDKGYVNREFPRSSGSVLLAQSKDGGDMIRAENLLELLEIERKIREELTVFDTVEESDITYADVCLRLVSPSSPCVVSSVLNYFNNNASMIEGRTPEQLRAIIDANAPGISEAARSFMIANDSKTVRSAFLVRSEEDGTHRRRGDLWEEKFATLNDEAVSGTNRLQVFAKPGTWASEVARSTGASILPLGVGIGIMMLFVLWRVGRHPNGRFRLKLALMSVFVVVASVASSVGLGSLLNVTFTSITPVIAFIAMGVGLDDVIILLDAFDNTPPHLTVKERTRRAMARAGTAITMTTLSSALAFGFGITSGFPALSAFCWNAAFVMFFLFFFTLTSFMAIVVIDERATRRGVAAEPLEAAAAPPVARKQLSWSARFASKRRRFMLECYTPMLASRIACMLITLITLGLTGGATYLVYTMPVGLEVKVILPLDSYVIPFDAELYGAFGGETDMPTAYVKRPKLHDPAVRAAMHSLEDTLSAAPDVIENSVDAFLPPFEAFVAEQSLPLATETDVAVAVDEFVHDARYRALRSRLSIGPTGEIRALAFAKFHAVPAKLGSEATAQYERIRALLEESAAVRDKLVQAFAFHPAFLFRDADTQIIRELAQSLIGGNILIMLMLFTFLSPRVALFTFLTVLNSQLQTVASVHVWSRSVLPGAELNIVSLVTLVLSVAFSVDYSSHLAHTFVHCRGTNVERTAYALVTTGNSVLAGGFSTLLGVSMLSWAGGYSFRIFFWQMLVIVVAGLYHGLFVLPTLLIHLGPNNDENEEDDDADAAHDNGAQAMESGTASDSGAAAVKFDKDGRRVRFVSRPSINELEEFDPETSRLMRRRRNKKQKRGGGAAKRSKDEVEVVELSSNSNTSVSVPVVEGSQLSPSKMDTSSGGSIGRSRSLRRDGSGDSVGAVSAQDSLVDAAIEHVSAKKAEENVQSGVERNDEEADAQLNVSTNSSIAPPPPPPVDLKEGV